MSSEQVVSRFVKTVFRFLFWLSIFTALAFLFSGIRFKFLDSDQRPHFWNFSSRLLDSSLSALSKTRLGFFYEGLFGGAVLTAIVLFFLLRKLSPSEDWASHAKNALLALLVGVLVPSFIFASTYLWKTVTGVYDDHHDNIERLKYTEHERDQLKVWIQDRDKYIRTLEGRACPKCSVAPIRKAEAEHPETIQDVVATVRTTCILRDPSRMPVDLPLMSPSEDSYLEGMIGKAYLYSRSATFKRTEQEGSAIAIENFRPVPNSDLIGMEVSKLSDYSTFHVSFTSVAGGQFSRCTFLEVTLRVNGRDVFRHSEPINLTLDDVHGFSFTIKLEGMNLK